VNDLPDRMKGTFPHVIRNLRPRRWPTIVMRLCLLSAGISCLLGIAATYSGIPQHVVTLLLAPAVLGTAGAVAFAVAEMVTRPIDKVLLGETFEIWPDKSRYRLSAVVHIEFVSGPEEDYVETNSSRPVRRIQIALRGRFGLRSLKLTISADDALRLSEWTTEKSIRLTGADHFAS
jgi:hypothetical protein